MNILIDTHVFLWWDCNSSALPLTVRERVADADNIIYVSAASVWEIEIKRRLQKLTFAGSPTKSIAANGFLPLAMTAADAERAGSLDWEHKDPFDRMLVAQCLNENLALVTADETLRGRSDIPVIWAR